MQFTLARQKKLIDFYAGGISYYLQVIWHEENGTNEGKERAAFSLLDDLWRMFAQVRHGNCEEFDSEQNDERLDKEGCDCNWECVGKFFSMSMLLLFNER